MGRLEYHKDIRQVSVATPTREIANRVEAASRVVVNWFTPPVQEITYDLQAKWINFYAQGSLFLPSYPWLV